MITEIANMLDAAHKTGQRLTKIRVSRLGYQDLVDSTKVALPDGNWGWAIDSPLPEDTPMVGQYAGLLFGVPVHMADSELAPALSFEIAD